MAEISTIARPYAEAVFRLAEAAGRLGEWLGTLQALSQVAVNDTVTTAIRDPKMSATQTAGVFLGVLDGKLAADEQNFVRILAENRRLELLPEIRDQFEVLKNEREGVQEVEIISAFPLDAAQQGDLVSRLEKHTGRKVSAQVTVDPALLGGVKIVIGDKVIDASARAQLAALETALRA